jgi:hypothetical protein
MSELQVHNKKVWDRLFDLLYACDESVSDAEVDADLLQAGIDMRPAFRRLSEIIEQRKAHLQLALARETRQSMMDKLRGVAGPKITDLRNGVREFIDRVFSGPEQVAHYHKLEKAATEEDLQSLMDDLTMLAELRQTKDKDESKAE